MNFNKTNYTFGKYENSNKKFESLGRKFADKLPDLNNRSIQAIRSTTKIVERPIRDKKGKVISMKRLHTIRGGQI